MESIETNFIPTRYEDRGDSYYFTNEDQSIVVAKHTAQADAYMDALVAPEATEEVVEPSTGTNETENQVEVETTPEGENLAPEEVQEEATEEVTPETVNEDRSEEVSTPSEETAQVDAVDESTEGNL